MIVHTFLGLKFASFFSNVAERGIFSLERAIWFGFHLPDISLQGNILGG